MDRGRLPSSRLLAGSRFLPLAAWCGLVWFLSSQTGDTFDDGWSVPDWAAHIAEFAAGGFLARFAFAGVPVARATLVALAFCLAWGVLDEWHQSFVPGRDPSGTDVAADLLGAGLGAWLHAVVARTRARDSGSVPRA